MADQNKPESAPEPVEKVPPTPVFKEASAAQPTSPVDVDALVAKTVAALEPLIEKKVQSVKDKRIDELQRRVGRADLEDLGVELTPEQELKLRLRDLEARVQQPVQKTSLASGAPDSAHGDTFDVVAFAKEKGIDLNNADAARIVTTPHNGPADLKADLLEWRLTQLTKQPDSAAAPSLVGGGVPPPEPKTDAQILAEMHGSTNPFAPQDLKRRAEKGDGGVAGY